MFSTSADSRTLLCTYLDDGGVVGDFVGALVVGVAVESARLERHLARLVATRVAKHARLHEGN